MAKAKGYPKYVIWLLRAFLVFVCLIPHLVRHPRLLAIPVVVAPVFGIVLVLMWSARIRSTGVSSDTWYAWSTILVWYLLTMFLFATAYKAASQLGSCIVSRHSPCIKTIPELMYYSIVTASTLGYGDFWPKGGIARFLSCAQVIEFWLFFVLAIFFVYESLKQGMPGGRRRTFPARTNWVSRERS